MLVLFNLFITIYQKAHHYKVLSDTKAKVVHSLIKIYNAFTHIAKGKHYVGKYT